MSGHDNGLSLVISFEQQTKLSIACFSAEDTVFRSLLVIIQFSFWQFMLLLLVARGSTLNQI
jgi:hypothetical protein